MWKVFSCSNYGGTLQIDKQDGSTITITDFYEWNVDIDNRSANINITVGSYNTGFESLGMGTLNLPIFQNEVNVILKKVTRKNRLVKLQLIPEIYYNVADGTNGLRWVDVSSATSITDVINTIMNALGIDWETNSSYSPTLEELELIKDYLKFHTISSASGMLGYIAGLLGTGWYIDIFKNKVIFDTFTSFTDANESPPDTPIRSLESYPQQYFSDIILTYAPTKTQLQISLPDGSGSAISIEVPFVANEFDISQITEWVKKMRIGYYKKIHTYHYNELYNELSDLYMKKITYLGEDLLVTGFSVSVNAPNCFIDIKLSLIN
jgi:hypothetical protein